MRVNKLVYKMSFSFIKICGCCKDSELRILYLGEKMCNYWIL